MPVRLSGTDVLGNSPAQEDESAEELYELESQTAATPAHQITPSSRLLHKLGTWVTIFENYASRYRVFNVPIINYIILILFTNFLVRLSFKYHKLYTKSSLAATILTNVVLYGISDSLAQTIPALAEQRRIIINRRRSNVNRNRSSSVSSGNSISSVSSVASISSAHEVAEYIRSVEVDDLFVDYGDNLSNISADLLGSFFGVLLWHLFKLSGMLYSMQCIMICLLLSLCWKEF
ncbi:unnamed protein product [Ambrosiozyma monospora]|uniref:Unnamed protein product n=1 Tax=Ambrosiozyma monospora TaxID=43982 RepID=A0A9W6Z3P6_AMBMO|nr:unnamed protein product [Ambrosiozyma monospora]